MKYRILVTGGAGYLGSILVPELLTHGHRVTVVDNFLYRQNSLAHLCYQHDFQVVNADVRNQGVMNPLIDRADIIIPLAALVGAPVCSKDPVGATTINHDAVISMFKRLSENQRVLMPTTNSAYGSGGEGHYCDETSPLSPISLYAKDKVAVEKVLLERENAISFRLATVFGMSTRMRIDLLVNDFVYRAINDRFIVLFEGHFKRNYIHVRDVARAFLHGIEHFEEMKHQIYNVGLSDANVSKMELCHAIQKQIPDFIVLEAPIGKDIDQRNYVVSNAKIERTGFMPAYSIDTGIAELIKGFSMIKNSKYGNI